MATTLKDVAERAGVSRSAVSRTFTEGASVSGKTRKKVEKAARELGYSPSFIARSLTTRRTKLIGLVSNNFQNPAFMEVFDLFTLALQERGLRPLLVNLSNETDPANSVRMLRQYSVDGVIVASSTLPPTFSLAFKDAGVPVVHAFGRYSNTSDVHVVGVDNKNGGKLAAELLIRHGYTNLAFLGGPKEATSTQDRLAGFRKALKALHARAPKTFYAANYSYQAGRAAMENLLREDQTDGVFCGDDVLCMGALDAAREAGLQVPQDLGFVGFNNMEMAGWSAFDLTTIQQPIRDIILSSVDLIVTTLNNPERTAEARLFPCSVVERSTLRPCDDQMANAQRQST